MQTTLVERLRQFMERELTAAEVELAVEAYLLGQKDCNDDFCELMLDLKLENVKNILRQLPKTDASKVAAACSTIRHTLPKCNRLVRLDLLQIIAEAAAERRV